MQEQQARELIVAWATQRFAREFGDLVPEVRVVSMWYDQSQDKWKAKLSLSAQVRELYITLWCYVTFWLDEVHHSRGRSLRIFESWQA